MAILSTDLIFYASASVPIDDTSTSGGAIDNLRYFDFTQITADDDIEIVSTSASDVQNCTVVARGADGTVSSQTAALTGTTAKIFNTLGVAGVVGRVLSVELASNAVGTITVKRSVGGAVLRDIPIGKRGFMAFLRQAASDPSSTRTFYIKGFWKNEHGSLALLGATVKQNADPTGKVAHALSAAVNDSASVANRLTTPGLTFNDTDKAVPGTDLAAGAAIGTWLQVSLTAAEPPIKSTYTTELSGSST